MITMIGNILRPYPFLSTTTRPLESFLRVVPSASYSYSSSCRKPQSLKGAFKRPESANMERGRVKRIGTRRIPRLMDMMMLASARKKPTKVSGRPMMKNKAKKVVHRKDPKKNWGKKEKREIMVRIMLIS